MYGKLTEKYDTWSSWDTRLEAETTFFGKLIQEHRVETTLDCACGTGIHAIALSKIGFKIDGSDIDEQMISQARHNAQSQKVAVDFRVCDFRSLTEKYDRTYNAVMCIGNSLSHMLTDEDVQRSIDQMYQILSDNGILILHLRNYQKMLKEKQRFFVYKCDDEMFFYVWDFEPEYRVNIINYNLKNEEMVSCSFRYNPIVKKQITEILHKAGFTDLQFYADTSFKRYMSQSDDDLYIIGRK